MRPRLMFVVNVDWPFLSHRLPIALSALEDGYEVHVVCADTGRCIEIEAYGLIVHRLNLVRGKASVISSFFSFCEIVHLFWKIRPDIVHLVTLKPVLFGGVAARLLGVPAVVAAIPGLGFVFIAQGFIARLRRAIVGIVYRLALGKENLKVIFQNPDDRDLLCKQAGVPASKVVLIRGSGVDLAKYTSHPQPDGLPIVMLAARLLHDKGVMEFVQAARELSLSGCRARFCLVGQADSGNPATLTETDLSYLRECGAVEMWGHFSEMAGVLAKATIVVLPSYREGLPKVLLEAAACGRAVITTDVPGCRDAIEPGTTGLLVPVRNSAALVLALRSLLDDPRRTAQMGVAGRLLAESEFDVTQVVRKHLDVYRELLRGVK